MNKLIITTLLLTIIALPSCSKEPGGNGGDNKKDQEGVRKTLVLSEFGQLNQRKDDINSHAERWDYSSIKMDRSSLIEVANGVQYPHYPRLRTLPDGSYILFWHNVSTAADEANGKDCYYSISKDLKNWEFKGYLWKSHSVTTAKGTADTRYYTNPNGLVLNNGDLLVVAAFRAVKAYGDESCTRDQGLIIKRSSDGGKTWTDEKEIYHGPCWEAHLIQLESGEIQCFFSESRPWISGSHSGTDMVRSKDGGKTWEPALDGAHYRVMRKHWWNEYPKSGGKFSPAMYCYTYQMPVGVVLNNSKKFAFAMESANKRTVNSAGTTSDQFSIAIAYSKDNGEWDYLQGDEVLPREQRLDSLVERGAAPYLIQFPSGECLLTYGNGNSYQKMKTGNATATKFSEEFDGLPYRGSWGGMDMTGSHQAISYMRSVNHGSENATIQIARYNLNHDIVASNHSVVVDADNSEWRNTDDALFVGSKGNTRATLRCSSDKDNLYFLIEVIDERLSANDFATLYITDNNNKFSASSRRVKLCYNGLKGIYQYAGGWHEIEESGITAKVAYDGDPSNNSDTDNGYLAEICIPRSEIKMSGNEVFVNFSNFDSSDNAEDSVSDTNTPGRWMKLNVL